MDQEYEHEELTQNNSLDEEEEKDEDIFVIESTINHENLNKEANEENIVSKRSSESNSELVDHDYNNSNCNLASDPYLITGTGAASDFVDRCIEADNYLTR